MTNLQKLLEDRWPSTTILNSIEEGAFILHQRKIFTEGYNEAIKAAKDAIPNKDDISRLNSLSDLHGYNLGIEHTIESLNKL